MAAGRPVARIGRAGVAGQPPPGRKPAPTVAAVLAGLLIVVPLATVLAGSGGAGQGKGQAGKSQQPRSNPHKTQAPTTAPSATRTPTPTMTTPPTTAPTATPASTAAPPTTGFSVATWGSDANAGTLSSPWRTLQKAANAVPAGGIVYLRGGTYGGFTMTRSGTSTAEITFTEYPGEEARISGTGGAAKVVWLNGVHNVTISRLTIENGPSQYGAGVFIEGGSYAVTIANNILQQNRSFGLKIQGSTGVSVRNNEIRKNETGIEISGSGEGVMITGNAIHTNDRMIVNDSTAWNDRGANGIVFHRTTGRITVTNNTLYGNRGASHDYGFDGGAFEIYASSNLTISSNTLWDNENVVETGTDGTTCSNNVFARNVAYRGATTSVAGPSMGLILRCASNMLIANNTFTDLDKFTFDVSLAGGFSGSIDGLRILNNVAVSVDHPYSLDTVIPTTVTINYNIAQNRAGGAIAYVYGRGNTNTLSQFSSWTGFEAKGLQADPQYVNPAAADFTVKTTSPAIDKAALVSGITSGYLGLAPDIGRFEIK
jgi:parallel beta-helix repeat protein